MGEACKADAAVCGWVAQVNSYQCVPQSCNNAADIGVFSQYFSTTSCNGFPGAEVTQCSVQLEEYPTLPGTCLDALSSMSVDPGYIAAYSAWSNDNVLCLSTCTWTNPVSCTQNCNANLNVLGDACAVTSPTSILITEQHMVTLGAGKGTQTVTAYNCLPSACTDSDVMAAYATDRQAKFCGPLALPAVAGCQVTVSPYFPPTDNGDGAAAGITIGVVAGLVALGFGGYFVGIRTGLVRRESVPAYVQDFCECGICQRVCGSRSAPAGGYAVTDSSGPTRLNGFTARFASLGTGSKPAGTTAGTATAGAGGGYQSI